MKSVELIARFRDAGFERKDKDIFELKSLGKTKKNGFVFICENCDILREAISNNKDCCGRIDCGGPSVLNNFPKYTGLLSDGYLASHCFVCGMEASGVFSIKNRLLGICKKHKVMIKRIIDDFIQYRVEQKR